MVKIVTPREFRNAFAAVLTTEQANVREAVRFEAKSYAYFMRVDLLPKVARHLGLLAWGKEYCTLDGIFYEERETQQVRVNAMYAKWISVALEHERDARSTFRGINKLQLFNAPLKVLITYASEGAETDSLLRGYERIIRAADVFGDFATLRRQLVIFGTPGTAREWRFFAYEGDGFVHMLPLRETA